MGVDPPTAVRTASPAPRATVAPTDQPVISFVTVAYGTGPVIVNMIESLVATAVDDDRPLPIEVIVVDNVHPVHGNRAFTELLLHTRGVRVLRPGENLGFGGGCNLGAAHARAALIGFVNPDLTLQPGWLTPLVDLLDVDPSVAIAAPVLLDASGIVAECGQVLYADGTTSPITTPHDEPCTVDYASAACWLVRTVDFDALGGFDPAFFPAYFEDVDVALRVRAAGRRCVVHPASRVVHDAGTGTPDRPRPAFAQLKTLLAKWPDLADRQPAAAVG